MMEDEDEKANEPDAFADASFYTELSTNLLYEVKFFETFVLTRPASPSFYLAIRKIDTLTFVKEFDEYLGDPDQLRAYLYGLGDYSPLVIQ